MEYNSGLQKRAHLTKEQRLPKCFKEVEKVIRSVKSCQSNFKTVLANSRLRGSVHKKVYNLSINVLKYYNYIQEIINKMQLLEKEKFLRREIASVLIYEMIFGNGSLPGESKIVITIRAYENDIWNIHNMFQSNSTNSFIVKEINVPRYVRVHTLVTTVSYVIKDLESFGFKQINYDDNISEKKYFELIGSLELGSFLIDYHFKDVLVFAHSENLVSLDLYKNGHIFFQDKASCIPVHVLNPEPGCAVLDACAAPGMKSLHIAAKMKNKGILIACEKDKSRFETLKEMIQYGAIKICKVLCKDFKLLDPNDQAYSTVEYILLDPSCSGSGMVNRMDEVTDTEDSKNKERLMKLAGFQIILLKHALRFPNVKKVVYSTCSINEEENEYVVHEALTACNGAFKLSPVMPEWSVRGSENFEFGKLCLRTFPEKHLTNGFFVAMFERVDCNEYRNGSNFSKKFEKHELNTDTLPETRNSMRSDNQRKETLQLERYCEKKKMDKTSKSCLVDGSHKYGEPSLDLCKKKENESHPQQPIHFKKSCNPLLSKQFKKKSTADTLDILNTVSENYKSSNENRKKMQGVENMNFDCESPKYKKKERENSIQFLYECNEKLPNVILPESQQKCSDKGNISSKMREVVDYNIGISMRKEKGKHKRHFTTQNIPESIEITGNTLDVMSVHKKKKHSKHEHDFPVDSTYEIFFVKEKKSKKHKNCCNDSNSYSCVATDVSVSHMISGSSSAKMGKHSNNNDDLHKQENVTTFSKTEVDISNNFTKYEKHKFINASDKNINIPPVLDLGEIANEAVLSHNPEKIMICNSVQNDYLPSKKSKKCKSKKHETEKTLSKSHRNVNVSSVAYMQANGKNLESSESTLKVISAHHDTVKRKKHCKSQDSISCNNETRDGSFLTKDHMTDQNGKNLESNEITWKVTSTQHDTVKSKNKKHKKHCEYQDSVSCDNEIFLTKKHTKNQDGKNLESNEITMTDSSAQHNIMKHKSKKRKNLESNEITLTDSSAQHNIMKHKSKKRKKYCDSQNSVSSDKETFLTNEHMIDHIGTNLESNEITLKVSAAQHDTVKSKSKKCKKRYKSHDSISCDNEIRD